MHALLVLLGCLVPYAVCSPDGAPVSACQQMEPQHPGGITSGLSSTPPYTLTVNEVSGAAATSYTGRQEFEGQKTNLELSQTD